MAIATTQGHVQRAIDFYNKEGKYFIIGGTSEWSDHTAPDAPSLSDYKLKDVIGLKRVDICNIVKEVEGSSDYDIAGRHWKVISIPYRTKTRNPIAEGSTVIDVESVAVMKVGSKLRINNLYEGTITSFNSDTEVELDTPAPEYIPTGSVVEGGALVEGAVHVYVQATLTNNEGDDVKNFPLTTFRQIGLCTEIEPIDSIANTDAADILLPATDTSEAEYKSLGVLEIIDNRIATPRTFDTTEVLSIICEF